MSRDDNRFIGRAGEIEQVAQLVATGAPLITLLGPGGVGKTRLARVCAARAAEAMASSFCDLSETRALPELLATVAAALGIPLGAGTGAAEAERQIGHALAARPRSLIVLDNVEQVAGDLAKTVDRWLDRAPAVTFLLTSREPLRIAREQILPIRPLGVLDGVMLFEQRARAARGGVSLSAAERALSASIVERLDGLPLAIELAASRAGVLAVSEISDRLRSRFELLRSARRDRPPRHDTLEAAIAWSWDLLASWERAVLAQCAVFRGGFDASAVEAAIDLSDLAGAPAILDVLAALRDKSLLVDLGRGASARPRFGMLESIREFAALRLPPKARDQVERRHALYFVEYGERWAELAEGPKWSDALEHLDAELENLIGAAQRSRKAAPGLTVRAVLALDVLLSKRGPFELHLRLLDGAEAAAKRLRDPVARARVLRARAEAARLRGRLADAEADADAALRSVRSRRAPADLALVSRLIILRGQVDVDRGRRAAGRTRMRRGVALARKSGDRRAIAMALCRLGDGSEVFAEALPLARSIGDRRAEAYILANWGRFERERRRLAPASARLGRALDIARELRDRPLESMLTLNMALLHHVREDLERAQASCEEAIFKNREVGNRRVEAIAWTHLGIVLHEAGALPAAASALDQAMTCAADAGDEHVQALPLGHLAVLAASQGDLDGSARMLARARRTSAHDPVVSAALEVLEGHLVLARARRVDGDAVVPREVRARLEAPAASSGGPKKGFGLPETMAMIERRILDRAVRGAPSPRPSRPETLTADPATAAPRARARTLHVPSDAAWLRLDGDPRVSLQGRKPLRRILRALLQRRQDAPGEPLAPAELMAVAWPGERLVPKAAKSRLHNAISSLRAAGLRDWILTRSDGYMIDPRLTVRSAQEDVRAPEGRIAARSRQRGWS